jgi:hypothetical protein
MENTDIKKIEIFDEARFHADMKAGDPCGLYRIPESVYRPAAGHNWSTIKHMKKSANSYKVHLGLSEDSPDMQIGRIFHAIILEPEELKTRYVTPEATYPAKGKKKDDPPEDKPWNYNAHYCRTWRSQMEESGVEVVTEKQIQEAHALAAAILKKRWLQQALKDAVATELAVFWTDYSSSLLCKGKLDILLPSGAIVDLKSWNAKIGGRSELDAAASEAYYSNHHCQAAFYRDGLDRVLESQNLKADEEGLVIFAYVDKTPEHDTAILGMSNCEGYPAVYPWIAAGRAVYTGLLLNIARCEQADEWPSTFMGDDGFGDMQLFYVPEFLDKRLAVTD